MKIIELKQNPDINENVKLKEAFTLFEKLLSELRKRDLPDGLVISLNKYITSYDHWIAFGLLAFIGGKMIYEGFQIEKCEMDKDCLNSVTLLVLAIATSIDALAVGVVFSSLSISVIKPVAIIGLITFIICFAGVYIGDKFGSFFEKKMELVGGSVLILIGIKILVEHLIKGN